MIYTRPAGGLSPAGHFISLLLMYSFTMNLTCAPKFLSASSAIFCIFSAVSLSKRIDLIISPVVIPVGYVPPLSEIQGFFKIKIRRPSLRVFL